jgi:hypothetical protein
LAGKEGKVGTLAPGRESFFGATVTAGGISLGFHWLNGYMQLKGSHQEYILPILAGSTRDGVDTEKPSAKGAK